MEHEIYLFDASTTNNQLPMLIPVTAEWADSVATTHHPLRAHVSGRDCIVFRRIGLRRDFDIRMLAIFWAECDNPAIGREIPQKARISPFLLRFVEYYPEQKEPFPFSETDEYRDILKADKD